MGTHSPSDITTDSITVTHKKISNDFESGTDVRTIEELKKTSHGISSGKIVIIGDKTIHIPNFHFDGRAPQAYFLIGKGDIISGEGTKISVNPLPKYDGQNLNLTLPNDLKLSDFSWLVVWCYAYNVNLGYVYLNKKKSSLPPQTFGLKNKVTSGPIVLLNKKELFIPDIRYDGQHRNVHFWVGNGSEPTSDGIPVPDERGSSDNLKAYQGQNIYISLPDGITTDNIEYFGVWSVDERLNMGHVNLKGIEGVPEPPLFGTSTQVLRVPKCCPAYSVITPTGCTERPSVEFMPEFNIYIHNDTHFNNHSLDKNSVNIQPYIFALECKSGKYPLEEESEEFAILKNGSLLVKGSAITGILSQQRFCLDNIDGDSKMKIFVCVPEYMIQEAMFYTYVTLTLVSTFCFIATFIIYFFWMNIEDIHKKYFTAYIFAMSVSFLSLTIVQIGSVEDGGCEVLGFIFQIAMISSFTLLAILCFDILIFVKFIDEDSKKQERKRYYLIFAIGVPLLSMIVSLIRDLTPDVPNSFFKPQYHKNTCYFEAENQRSIYFYTPIILSIIVCVASLIKTKLQIIKNDRDLVNHYFWIEKGKTYKFMWRKYLIIFGLSFLWHTETLIHLYWGNANILSAIDVVEASQGIFVVLLFVANNETRTIIWRNLKFHKKKKKKRMHFISEDGLMLKTLDS